MSQFRGWIGEKKAAFYLWLSLDKTIYHRFHDITILANNGTTQIDHLIISKYGLFIVETKNRKGWIFGSAHQSKWTQTIHGMKFSFHIFLTAKFSKDCAKVTTIG